MSRGTCKPAPVRVLCLPAALPAGRLVELKEDAAARHASAELRAWRLFGAELMPLLEEALAAQGESPDARTLSLQHSLAELLRSPANTPGA